MNLEGVTGESNPGTIQRKYSWLVYSPLVLSVISWCKPGTGLRGVCTNGVKVQPCQGDLSRYSLNLRNDHLCLSGGIDPILLPIML